MHPTPPPESDGLTWAALLSRWTDFAKASLALPKTQEGDRWRAAVPDIIALQALTHALDEVDFITAPGERAVAIDLAEIQFRTHATNLHQLWGDEPLHEELLELVAAARLAIDGARAAGIEWLVAAKELTVGHPATLVDALLSAGFKGDLYVPTPGVPLFEGSPAVFLWTPGGAIPTDEIGDLVDSFHEWDSQLGEPTRMLGMRQVYRQFDFALGRPVRDLVLPMHAGLPGGQPLLVCAIDKGVSQPVALPRRKSTPLPPIPVEFADELPE